MENDDCKKCEGRGEVVRPGTPLGEILNVDDWIECPTCHGSGKRPTSNEGE